MFNGTSYGTSPAFSISPDGMRDPNVPKSPAALGDPVNPPASNPDGAVSAAMSKMNRFVSWFDRMVEPRFDKGFYKEAAMTTNTPDLIRDRHAIVLERMVDDYLNPPYAGYIHQEASNGPTPSPPSKG
jgi:hypothetical protein